MIEEFKTKLCTKCNVEKCSTEFHKNISNKDKLSEWCKICNSNYGKLHWQLTKDKITPEKKLQKKLIKRNWDILNQEKLAISRKQKKSNNIISYLLIVAKCRAKKKKIEFNITENDLILTKNCPILNKFFELNSEKHAKPYMPSIDRIDSKKGYIKGNCRIISFRANELKSNATKDEFKKIINYIKNTKIINITNNNSNINNFQLKKIKRMYNGAKKRSKEKNITFNIILNDLKCLFVEYCSILGVKLDWINGNLLEKSLSPSLDRIDNSKGYEVGNIAIISWRINSIKRDATLEELQLIHDRAFEPTDSPIFQSQEINSNVVF